MLLAGLLPSALLSWAICSGESDAKCFTQASNTFLLFAALLNPLAARVLGPVRRH
ncbi:MAG: hypothetical protein R2748_24985 [Bryobacterales bacterium]